MKSQARRTKIFYDLPRDIAVHVFSFLPLPALLGAQLVSKRFYNLTNGKEFEHCFFLSSTPLLSISPSTKILLHPIFERLDFSAYHSPKVIRIGEDLDSLSLHKAKVSKQFATYPALKSVVVKVLSGGDWPFSANITVENDGGVTVWDVINETTTFFKTYTKVSFADHFGVDVCEERGYDPKVLMQNHDFLDPKMSFPNILFLDRSKKNTIIADFGFNKFASLPLIKRPLYWSSGNEGVAEAGGVEEEPLCEDNCERSNEGERLETHESKLVRDDNDEGMELARARKARKAGGTAPNNDRGREEPSTSSPKIKGNESMDMVDEFLGISGKEHWDGLHLLSNEIDVPPELPDERETRKLQATESPVETSPQINTTETLENIISEDDKIQNNDSYTSDGPASEVSTSQLLEYETEIEKMRVEIDPQTQDLPSARDDAYGPGVLGTTLTEPLDAPTDILPSPDVDVGSKNHNLGFVSSKAYTMAEESDDWENAFA